MAAGLAWGSAVRQQQVTGMAYEVTTSPYRLKWLEYPGDTKSWTSRTCGGSCYGSLWHRFS